MLRINIKFIVLTIAAYIFAYLQGGNLPYSIFYGFSITFLIGLYSIIRHRQKAFVDVRFSQRIYYVGDSDIFSMEVYNNSYLPMPYVWLKNKALTTINSKYNGEALSLKLDESKQLKHEITFMKRGIYKFGDITMNLKEQFCIFETNKTFNREYDIKVYPKIYCIEKTVLKGSDIFKNAVSNKSRIEDAYSTRDMRKYRDGDNLKRINWKVSAKYNELYVRDFDTVSGREFNIFLNMSKLNYEIDPQGNLDESLVDFCVSLVNFMMEKEIKSSVFINATRAEVFEVEVKTDFDKLLEYFLTQFSDSDLDFTKYLSGNINKVSSLGGIGIITGTVDRYLTETLMQLRDSGYNVVVFHTGGHEEEFKNIMLLSKVGVECINIVEFLDNNLSAEIG